MKIRVLCGTALAFAAAGGIHVASAPQQSAGNRLDPMDPLSVARTLCGGPDGNGFLKRRAAFLTAASAYAQDAGLGEGAATDPVTGLGPSYLEITTGSGEARQQFLQGLRWANAFNHAAAIQSFRAAQAADPDCAMCLWGESWALGPNINAPMNPDDNARALETARAALARSDGAGPTEQALINALQTRYSDAPDADRAALDAAFADAMAGAADAYPDNDEIQSLAVEAAMDTQAWDYWEADQLTPKGRMGVALQRLERVLTRNPDHAPSIHLYIHATEASANPWRAEPYAERLAALAPRAGHLVHMPSHTYYRIGRFADSIETNIDAVVADEAYLDAAGEDASPVYRYGYYPHNVHFVLTSAQRAGDAQTVAAFGPKLAEALPPEMAKTAAWVTPIAAAPTLAAVQFEAPETILARSAPPDGAHDFLKAAALYARGEAQARSGDAPAARETAEEISALKAEGDFQGLIDGFVPALEVVEIMHQVVLGRAAVADEDYAAAIDHFGAAAAIQDALPYTEPPYWYYPVRQSYAAALLMDRQIPRAEQEFYRTLVQNPDNAWAYWGLAMAREARGDVDGAALARQQAGRGWLGEEGGPSLDQL